MIKVDKSKCIKCGRCLRDCYFECINPIDWDNPVAEEQCMVCGHCIAVCPVKAISLEDDEYELSGLKEYREHKDEYKKGIPQVDSDRLLDLIKARRTGRQYTDKPVSRDLLDKMLEAGRYVATANNSQKLHFVVVQDRMAEFKQMCYESFQNMNEKLSEQGKGVMQLSKQYHKDRIFWGAPCLVLVATEHPQESAVWESGMASQAMELIGNSEGLLMLYSGCICNLVREDEKIARWLGVENLYLRTALLMGYPSIEYYRDVPRKKAKVTWR